GSSHVYLCCTATAASEIHTLSLHDALPILVAKAWLVIDDEAIHPVGSEAHKHVDLSEVFVILSYDHPARLLDGRFHRAQRGHTQDRKSTRLNSSHVKISYAVFCLKKKDPV